eukprot:CCRYP_018052-RA/>CCRYP_018052-RA protein AED:0.40 eAED:0.37 QI:0/0/0/0.5/0/0/2/0/85
MEIGDYRQCQTDCNIACENRLRVVWDFKVGDQVLLWKEGILHKVESLLHKEPRTISEVHTDGTMRIQCGNKLERLNIKGVTPYFT